MLGCVHLANRDRWRNAVTREQFWSVIESSRTGLVVGRTVEETQEQQAEQLHAALSPLLPEEVQRFDQHFSKFLTDADRWDLWGVAYLINGGCSDDGFAYFRRWLVARGEADYTVALRDPDSLVSTLPEGWDDDADFEEIKYVAGDVYLEKTGIELADVPLLPDLASDEGRGETKGEPWTEDDLPTLLPRIWARFG